MALELNRPLHLATGIKAADVSGHAADAPRRIGIPYLIDERPGLFGQIERLTPQLKIILAEHRATAEKKSPETILIKLEEGASPVDCCLLCGEACSDI